MKIQHLGAILSWSGHIKRRTGRPTRLAIDPRSGLTHQLFDGGGALALCTPYHGQVILCPDLDHEATFPSCVWCVVLSIHRLAGRHT